MDRIHLLLLLKAALGVCTVIIIFVAGWLARELSWRKREHRRRYELAVHEAGHAVVAWQSRIDLVVVLVAAPLPSNPYRGRAYFWSRKPKAGPGYKLDLAIIYAAGQMAEETICGRLRRSGSRSDRVEAKRLIEEAAVQGQRDPEFLAEKVLQRCRRLVRCHRSEIEQVAKALLARKCLKTSELESLLGPRQQSPKTP